MASLRGSHLAFPSSIKAPQEDSCLSWSFQPCREMGHWRAVQEERCRAPLEHHGEEV